MASAGAALVTALVSDPHVRTPQAWRRAQADGVRAAIMRDLLGAAEGVASKPRMTVCIALATGGGEQAAEVSIDPPPELLSQLALGVHPIVPLSRCQVEDYMLVDEFRSPAVLLEVSDLQWIAPDCVKAQARWHRGALSDVGYLYTVSRAGGQWTVDTAKWLWIS